MRLLRASRIRKTLQFKQERDLRFFLPLAPVLRGEGAGG
jgi:hypothetical protein